MKPAVTKNTWQLRNGKFFKDFLMLEITVPYFYLPFAYTILCQVSEYIVALKLVACQVISTSSQNAFYLLLWRNGETGAQSIRDYFNTDFRKFSSAEGKARMQILLKCLQVNLSGLRKFIFALWRTQLQQ